MFASPVPEEDVMVEIVFGGQTFEPLLSGALYWPAEQTLLVADLHLEKMASFAAKGQLLPPYDTRMTLALLARDIADTGAKRVICLGDSFHRDESAASLPAEERDLIAQLVDGREWLWLAGNHDPAPHALGGECHTRLGMAGLTLMHEPLRGLIGQIAGHLHPAARVMLGGRSVRRPCFVHDENLMILPAYGAATGSLNILSEPFHGLFGRDALNVMMLGRGRVYPVSPKRLVSG